ncbi:type VI secretion system ATPase TssH [Azotobacter chroococcum]|uniref:Type VI secretion system ATPase TssH n=1 Tax=Azotobacter chroococcum TaxID=353 RepID=A0AA44C639_9GAMM|nr:type VI secretion system ATPase TssH [Azotobacter chroococcum]NHN77120.1 type VI secretion system ATPase TssH [Azotobacter chroococcum]
MINVDLQQLVQALDADTRRDLEGAAGRCVARGGSQVLVEDLLLGLLERPDGLLGRALEDAGIEPGELARVLEPRREAGASRNPVFAAALLQWLQDALLQASLELGQSHIDAAALLLALLRNPLQHAGTRYQALLARIDADRLRDFALGRQAPAGNDAAAMDSMLARFTHDFTAQARAGLLDPVLCRDGAIRQLIDILARRRKNNPLVVGEAGVGKTAVVEGLALRIAAGEVPPALQGVELRGLDLGLLQAGAGLKGEFERRLQGLIDEVQAASRPIVLFIDEAHTLIGAGGQAGTADAANLLKPALARGALRTIAATTWSEYRKYFEKDPALARRFQPVQLHEPTVDEAVTILRGLAPVYAKSHGIYLRDDAVVAAAELSARYLAGRQLPDKALDVLDTACARLRIGLAAAPAAIERRRGEIAENERRRQALCRDRDVGLAIDAEALATLEERLATMRDELQALEDDWAVQRALAERLLELRRQGAGADDDAERAARQDELRQVQAELAAAQAGQRLVSFEVCPRLVAEVIAQWTGVPLEQLAGEHSQRIARFAGDLRRRLRGQEQAVQVLDRTLRAGAAGLKRTDAPLGVFLLVGPCGVGKTETALALADLLYGGERFLTTLNMGEFQEKHSVARLIGAPPGYVGYGEGGLLTEAVRQRPYSVILLDEVEKADPEVLNLFYQIFDKGLATDSEGRRIDFRNCLILLTSNLASERIVELCADGRPAVETLEQAIRPLLARHFKPALLARMEVVPYYPLDDERLRELVEVRLARFAERLQRRHLAFSHSPALVGHLAERCGRDDSGARAIERLLERQLQPLVVDRLLAAMAGGEPVQRVHATLDGQGGLICEFA